MIKIVLSYIHFPFALAKYFERALHRRNDVELFTVGPYTGAWIPWAGGINLPAKYAVAPDLPLPANGTLPIIPIGFVEKQLPWTPDLWLQIDAGWSLRGKPQYGKNVFVATDPHVLNYDTQRGLADTFYCMQSPYMQPGDEYLPYAYDPTIHYPEDSLLEFDACLVGLLYQEREQLIAGLRNQGLNVHYSIGPVFDEYREIYNRSTFALNWSSQQDLCARVWEGMAMKRVVVTNRVPDLDKFFLENRDYIGFDSIGEAIEKVLYFHQDDATKSIAMEGYKAVKPHTWDARIETILNDL